MKFLEGTTKRTIYRVVNDFEERGSVGDRPKHGSQRTARSAENITVAQESVHNNLSTSIRRRTVLRLVEK